MNGEGTPGDYNNANRSWVNSRSSGSSVRCMTVVVHKADETLTVQSVECWRLIQ